MKKPVIVLLAALWSGTARAIPTGRSHFLSHGPGAAEEALGEAVSASAAGPASLYYNSAGLSQGDPAVTAEWRRLFPGISQSWFGASFDLGFAQAGLGMIGLELGETTARDSLTGAGTPLGSHQRAYLLGSSREVWPGLHAGTAWGLLDYDLAGHAANAFFADAGVLYGGNGPWSVGVALKNAYFSGLDFGNGKEIYPRELRFGGSVKWGSLLLTGELDKTLDGSSTKVAFGAGYDLFRALSVRAGLNGYPRFGLGLRPAGRQFSLDLSYQTGALAGTQRLTATYYFRREDSDPPADAYTELAGKAESLKGYLWEEAKRLIEQKKDAQAREALEKLLGLEAAGGDAALALKALTNRVYPAPRRRRWGIIPGEKRRRRTYLRFAVAYAEGDALQACQAAREFGERWPKDARLPLMAVLISGKNCVPGDSHKNR